MREPNDQQKLFVTEHVKLRCKNATQAAKNAGYAEKSAHSQAYDLLKKPYIQDYLKKYVEEIKSEVEREFTLHAREAVNVLAGIMLDPDANDRDRIVCAKEILDRAGHKAVEKVENTTTITNNPLKDLGTDEIKKLIRGMG